MRTPLSGGLAAAALAFLLVGLAVQRWEIVLLALPPITFLAVGSLSTPPRPRLVAARSMSHERASVGREVQIDLLLRNTGPRLDLVEVADVLPRECVVVAGTNRAVVTLERDGTLHLVYSIRCDRRGEFEVGPARARSFDPLGLRVEDTVVAPPSVLVVAPAMEDLRRASLQPRRTRPWFGQIPSRRIGAGTEFWGVREYVPGDEVRRLNWKASARLDRLCTNEYEGDRSGDVVIVLDARRESFVGTRADNPIEHGVRAALAIADRVLAAKNRVGLVVQRQVLDMVPLAFGRKQLYRILEHLTHVRPGGEWPLPYLATVLSRFFPRDCRVVLITPFHDREALNAVVDLVAQGYDVAVLSPSALEIERRQEMPADAEGIAYRILRMERENRLMQAGRVAQVVDWDPALPLALVLGRKAHWPPPA